MSKTKNALFTLAYKARWAAENQRPQFFQAGFWNKLDWIASHSNGKLPLTGDYLYQTVTSVCGTVTLKLRLSPSGPKLRKGKAKHRVSVYCDKCDTWVWAGRINQHKCQRKPLVLGKGMVNIPLNEEPRIAT